MKTLDAYSLQVISKYLETGQDYINLTYTHRNCQSILDNYRFNPIPLDEYNVKLFSNIGEYHIYSLTPKESITFIKQLLITKPLPIVYWPKTKYSKQRPNQIYKYLVLNKQFDKIPLEVVEIGANCYRGSPMFKEIVVPTSITKINERAFYNCRNLENVYIPDSVVEIGEGCFMNCKNLKNIRLPNYIHSKTLPKYCFNNCSKLMHIDIPTNITKLDEDCFANCFNDSNSEKS